MKASGTPDILFNVEICPPEWALKLQFSFVILIYFIVITAIIYFYSHDPGKKQIPLLISLTVI